MEKKKANSKFREKSQNRKFAKIWTRENYQIYLQYLCYGSTVIIQCGGRL